MRLADTFAGGSDGAGFKSIGIAVEKPLALASTHSGARRFSLLAVFVASTAAYCIANVGWWLQPEMLSEVMPRFSVGETQASWILAAELAAITLSTLVLARFAGRITFARLLIAGLLVILAGQVTSVYATDVRVLLLARLLTGAGEGAALMISNAALANFADPDRAYGQMNMINVAVGAAMTFALPAFAHVLGRPPVFPAILFATLLLAPFLVLIPRGLAADGASQHGDGGSVTSPRSGSLHLGALMLATLLLGTGSGAVWAFLIEIGRQTPLTITQLNFSVATATLCALLGSGLAALFSVRAGRLYPFVCGLAALAVADFIITHTTVALTYRIMACVNVGCMYLLLPYLLGYAAALDHSGRYAAAVASMFLFTGATGPVLGGRLVEAAGIPALGIAVVIVAVLTLVLVKYVEASLRRVAATAAASGVASRAGV